MPGPENHSEQTQPMRRHRKIVLSISGHDPVGGAGIQADIEAISANGCHATTVITCLTVQDSQDVKQVLPVDADTLMKQAQAVLSDMPVAAIKIGLIGATEQIEGIASLLKQHPAVPVVLDPVLSAGGGAILTSGSLIHQLKKTLLPLTQLITPNRSEARQLANLEDADQAAQQLAEEYQTAVLLTGADETDGKMVTNRLFQPGQEPLAFSWPRHAGRHHGSGCTLASAIAARMALGEALQTAVKRGQSYTWQALGSAEALGRGQMIPRRIPK